MDAIETLMNLIVNFLISVGDAVIFLFLYPLKMLRFISQVNTRRKLSGEFRLTSPKKQIYKHYKISVRIPFFKIVKKIVASPVIVLILLFKAIKKIFSVIFSLPIRMFSSYRIHRLRVRAQKMAEQRRLERLKSSGLRPSIFYKLKYVFVGFLFSLIFIFVPLVSLIFVSDLPNLSDLSVNFIPKTTKIFDRNGSLLYEIYANQNRTVVPLSTVPAYLREATIAIEDKDFYNHPGFDLRGMVRAFVTDIRQKGFQGGSTITQQLIKSALLSPDPTVVRKIKEIALAFWAERVYPKDKILELYLNYVPYGGTAWGVQSAADIYFGEKVQDLDLAQAAFLAGLPQSPSDYSPFFNTGNTWKRRQKQVLDSMQKQGYISKADEDRAFAEELSFKSPNIPLKAPHFVMYVRRLLENRYGISAVERGGLTVRTSLDLNIQNQVQRIVSDEVNSDSNLNIGNGASLVTSPVNGDILAMIGSRDYFDADHDGNVNLTTSLRQPGSSIKLITYSLALSQGYTEASIMDDTPLTIPGVDGSPSYSPVNYDGTFHGRVPLRTAFANSFNIPPVRLTQKFGATTVKNFGERMGISSWEGVTNYGVSITLGGVDVMMTDLATAYGAIANEGNRVDLDPILEIKDSYGKSIYKKTPVPAPIVDPGVAFIISDILADNNARSIEFGLNTPLKIPGARVSVKTGTTDDKRDNWTVGFTPNILVATWVGNNDNSPMNPALASGITGAAPMWNKIMSSMLQRVGTASAVIVPPDVVKKYCIGMDRYFVKGTEDSVSCSTPPTPTLTPGAQ